MALPSFEEDLRALDTQVAPTKSTQLQETLDELLTIFKKADTSNLTVTDPAVLTKLDAIIANQEKMQKNIDAMKGLMESWQSQMSAPEESVENTSHKNFGNAFEK